MNRSRKTALLICTAFILPVIFAPQVHNQWVAILLIAIAAGGHQAWSANVLTLVSDIFPKNAIASVGGIGGMVGFGLGALSDYFLGHVLTNSGAVGYVYAFSIAGSLYIVALILIQILIPKMTPLDEYLKPIRN